MLGVVTIRCAMDIQFSGFEIFAPKIAVARTAPQRPYASHPTDWELDHLYARRTLAGTKLPSDHTHVALHPAPKATQPVVTDIGADRKPSIWMGRVYQELRNFDDAAGVDADPSVKRFARFPACRQRQGQPGSDPTRLASDDGFSPQA